MSKPASRRRKPKEPGRPAAGTSAYKASQDRKSARAGRIFTALVALVVLAGGAWLALDFTRKLAESDLTVIGQGTPVIVQVFDTNCAECTLLQREVRDALSEIPDDAVHYRVAHLQTREGTAFATAARLSYASLGLYDAEGTMIHAVRGVTPSETLAPLFRDLFNLPATR